MGSKDVDETGETTPFIAVEVEGRGRWYSVVPYGATRTLYALQLFTVALPL